MEASGRMCAFLYRFRNAHMRPSHHEKKAHVRIQRAFCAQVRVLLPSVLRCAQVRIQALLVSPFSLCHIQPVSLSTVIALQHAISKRNGAWVI
jgi:hypothetical protein